MSNVTKEFVLAGRSIFTIEIPEEFSAKHNLKPHYTFRVSYKAADGRWNESWFVNYLTGPDNTRDYSYIGKLNTENGQVIITPKSKLKDNSLLLKVLNRTLSLIWSNDVSPMIEKGFELHHEGRCGKCGRPLTNPLSIKRGIGPECWDNMNGGHYPHLSVPGILEDDADIVERKSVRDTYSVLLKR